MSADRISHREATHRDVHREGQDHGNHAHIDSSHLQRGAQKPQHGEQAKADNHLHQMGFPKTEVAHADHADRNFSPASKLNKHSGEGGGAKDGANKTTADHALERGVGKPEQPGAKGDHPAAKGDHPPAKGDQPAQKPAVVSPSDKPVTGTDKNPDGSSQSLVRDDLHHNYTGITRDKDGNVNKIQKIEQGKPADTTTYSKDGKPLSDTENGNGTRKWDHNGKLVSDTRTDKSNTNKPDDLKTTKNPDGSTTVKSGPGDGSSTETTFGKDGSIISQDNNNGTGSKLRNEFGEDGKLTRQQYTQTDKNGKQLEQNTYDYDKNGAVSRAEETNSNGYKNLTETDKDGNLSRRELNEPWNKYNSTETWGKDGYTSVTTKGGDRTTATVRPDGKVDFKHEKLENGW